MSYRISSLDLYLSWKQEHMYSHMCLHLLRSVSMENKCICIYRFSFAYSTFSSSSSNHSLKLFPHLLQFIRYTEEADEMWHAASDDVRATYGKRYLDAMLARQRASIKGGGSSTKPVIDALEDAIMSGRPETRYLIDGGWFDYQTV